MAEELVALKERVDRWRAGKKGKRFRIPEGLWDEAVIVARNAGVSQTSRATGFAYGDLKKRVAMAPAPSLPPTPAFVAIEMPKVTHDAKVAVELTRTDGSKMRIETFANQLEVRGLVDSFLSRTP
jgi:hypothetical protein